MPGEQLVYKGVGSFRITNQVINLVGEASDAVRQKPVTARYLSYSE